MPGTTPATPPPSATSPRRKRALSRAREYLGNAQTDPPSGMGTSEEPAGNGTRASRRMHLPLLTSLSGGCSTPVPDDEWAGLVEAAIGGDDVAVRRLFAAAARWANHLIHQRFWLLDAEAEIVSLLWDTLRARPGSSDDWRTLVRRRLARRQYRPSPEVAIPTEILEDTVPGGEFEARVLDQLDARRTLRALGPMPAGMGPYLAAVWTDQPPAPEAAHCARQYRYLRRRAVA
jgi:hypothetical protein